MKTKLIFAGWLALGTLALLAQSVPSTDLSAVLNDQNFTVRIQGNMSSGAPLDCSLVLARTATARVLVWMPAAVLANGSDRPTPTLASVQVNLALPSPKQNAEPGSYMVVCQVTAQMPIPDGLGHISYQVSGATCSFLIKLGQTVRLVDNAATGSLDFTLSPAPN